MAGVSRMILNSLLSVLTAGTASCGSVNDLSYVSTDNQCKNTEYLVQQQDSSVVMIEVESEKGDSYGTGFFVDEKGSIITSQHVVDKADRVMVKVNGFYVEYTEVKTVSKLSISLLEPKANLSGINHVKSFSNNVSVADDIYSIGNPFAFAKLFTHGYVSGYNDQYLVLNMPVYPGMSGSPVFNCKGDVIGVVFAHHKDGQTIGIANRISDIEKLKAVR